MRKIQRKYSSRFFCPLCRTDSKQTRMLMLDEELNLLRCEVHTHYLKQCNCRTKDMIVMDFYEEDLDVLQEEIDSLPLTTEEEAKRVVEDRLEQDLANNLLEAWGEDVEGFE